MTEVDAGGWFKWKFYGLKPVAIGLLTAEGHAIRSGSNICCAQAEVSHRLPPYRRTTIFKADIAEVRKDDTHLRDWFP